MLLSPTSYEDCSSESSSIDDGSGKQPSSWSGGEAGGGAAAEGGAPPPAPHGGHKARQKKFHRHFPQAALDERVLNYYSCALVGDILLQGHLYITKNYFAFYSNVFGYVTKLLIPLSSVVRVTKEKMARIIPNAVGVATLDDKHVFGSLLSRDTTFKLMLQVWKASPPPVVESVLPKELRMTKGESELSVDEESSSQSGVDDVGAAVTSMDGTSVSLPPPSPAMEGVRHRSSSRTTPDIPVVSTVLTRKPSVPLLLAGASRKRGRTTVAPSAMPPPNARTHSMLLVAATALLCLLFLSAGLMLYRIGKVYRTVDMDENVLLLKRGDDVYSQIFKWHSQLRSKSASHVNEFLHSNLDQIAKVRQSLETLSTLIAGIVTDKVNPMDTRQGGYIGRSNSEDSAHEGLPSS